MEAELLLAETNTVARGGMCGSSSNNKNENDAMANGSLTFLVDSHRENFVKGWARIKEKDLITNSMGRPNAKSKT
uniref:Uncharacterized protein n=1 Tax=Cannabis sativa TaxID=3483 RepID=A0A803QCT1_CANSA